VARTATDAGGDDDHHGEQREAAHRKWGALGLGDIYALHDHVGLIGVFGWFGYP
jgi:hypothetical protein